MEIEFQNRRDSVGDRILNSYPKPARFLAEIRGKRGEESCGALWKGSRVLDGRETTIPNRLGSEGERRGRRKKLTGGVRAAVREREGVMTGGVTAENGNARKGKG